jgi:hypothetical protein
MMNSGGMKHIPGFMKICLSIQIILILLPRKCEKQFFGIINEKDL